ncbi:MAG: hypothetical protein K0R57_2381 [Paenibacillaceae bacterium]|jgi:isopentenyldiphosphate isomerase|nr:hypothetical protein [Paenibacillaceae bacterium]
MSQEEQFDIFNEQMVRTGTASRKEVHARGLWHQTFHCWILSQETDKQWSLLLQLRHKDKDTFPDMLDISCAGHLLAGETPDEGTRELEEELGILADPQELQFLQVIAEENLISDSLIDREFCHVCLYECSQPMSSYRLQQSEVAGLFRVAVIPFMKLIAGEQDDVLAYGIRYEEETNLYIEENRSVRLEDIAPNSTHYYNVLFGAMNRFMDRSGTGG